MNKQYDSDNNTNEFQKFDETGSRPNDLIDGIAITIVIAVIITGILYYLYTM